MEINITKWKQVMLERPLKALDLDACFVSVLFSDLLIAFTLAS